MKLELSDFKQKHEGTVSGIQGHHEPGERIEDDCDGEQDKLHNVQKGIARNGKSVSVPKCLHIHSCLRILAINVVSLFHFVKDFDAKTAT